MRNTKPLIFSVYLIASCLLIMIGRFFVPTEAVPLPIYSIQWRFMGGFLECFYFFPALILSGLVLLFGLQQNPRERFKPFSPRLLSYLKTPILIGIVATLVYTPLALLAAPLVKNAVSKLRFQGELYTQSRASAVRYANQEDWTNAYQFMRVCDSIWQENPDDESLRAQIDFGVDSLRLSSSLRDASVDTDESLTRPQHPLGLETVDATKAISLADAAFSERRYYDSHRLAILAGRLARQGSVEARQAQRLASLAWNALDASPSSPKQEEEHYLYRQKRKGYESIVAEDWIHAYYTFKVLASQLPSDPDVTKFLALSEEGAQKNSFFLNEVDEHVGEMLSGTLFSLPIDNGGRAVMRVFSLSTGEDVSYGIGFELMAFSADGTLRYDITTPYTKLLPINLDGTEKLLIMLRALSRENEEISLDPIWSGEERPPITNAELILDVSYDDFLLLSTLRRGLDVLSINDLFIASDRFGDYGYITKVFEAELIYRLSEPVAMLSLMMLIILIGWRFRSSTRPKYLGVPMLFILPPLFNALVFCFHKALNLLSIISVITFSFSTAIVVFGVGLVCLFLLCLILVSAQHG